MSENRQKGKVMKDKFKSLGKRIVALLLSVLTVTMMFPLSAFAATENLGAVSDMKKLDISVSKHYGHEVHTTKKGGTTYPLFCIEYGTTSPSSSYLKGKKAMAGDTAIKAAKWIFAGYYLEHGNSIDWQDMAYCQKKVWSIFGSDTSWDFSDGGYKAWCDKAQERMDNLNKKPSFNNTNVGTIVAGNSLTVTDTNKVLSDYPAFTKSGSGWSITHSKNSNSLTIKVDKSCTASSFKLANGEYYKDGTGDDDELLLYYPYGSEAYQKLIYSAYYDPVSMAFSGSITPLGDMKLVKTSEDGIVAGINFIVTGANGFSKTVTTNANGEIDISDLVPGIYTITEENIDRYVPNQSQTITVSSGKTSSVSFYNILKKFRVTVVKVKAKDMAQKGVINITKTGEVFSSVEENNGVYTPKYSVGNLKGAVFEVYAAEDITTLDGTVRYEQGTLIDTVTTDDDGVAKSKELYLGKYTVIEKTAPNGYVHNAAKYDAELTYAGQNVSVTSTDISVYNDRQKVSVSLKKIMANDKTFGIGNNGEITSVRFGIYADEDIKASNGDVIPKDALITFANCDKNGSIVFDCDLPVGFKWYAKEIATDAHYILSDTKYEFDTEYQGQDIKVIDIKINNDKAIENNLIYGSVKGLKVDRETQEVIKGATFGLFKSDTTELTEENAILTAVTDENGIFTFSNIPYGEYLIKELKPADGYLDNEDVFTVTIKNNEQVVELTAINDKVPELKTTATVNGKKEVIAKGEITIKDTVEYKHLVPNTEYVIKGTLMDKATGKPFKVKGKEITSTVKFVPDKADGKVEVTFTFDGSAIKKDTELVVFETLYRDGVELTAHADIDDKGQTVTVKPYIHHNPKTGDDRNINKILGIAGASLVGIAGCVYSFIKRKKKGGTDNE